MKESEIVRGEWFDPDRGRVRLRDYSGRWLRERPGLAPRTVDLYDRLLRLHINPYLGEVDLVDLTTPRIREWHRGRLAAGVGQVTVAKAYRLLKTVLNTAVDEDELIRRNPCRVKKAGQERSGERPVLTVGQVYAIADAIRPWFRALVLVAGFTGLRWGELVALRRSHVDLDDERLIKVRGSLLELDGELVEAPPKSAAGNRDVAIPGAIVPELRAHMKEWAQSGERGRVFVGPKGATPRRSNFQPPWREAIEAAGVPGLHFHDLRHTGNHFAAQAASLQELMSRMGHASARAALIYQHATKDRERAIGDAISGMIEAARNDGEGHVGGTEPETGDDDGSTGVTASEG